jgi:hypothetical protein
MGLPDRIDLNPTVGTIRNKAAVNNQRLAHSMVLMVTNHSTGRIECAIACFS